MHSGQILTSCLLASSRPFLQTTSRRIANAKSGKFMQNIHKRGMVEDGSQVRECTAPGGLGDSALDTCAYI